MSLRDALENWPMIYEQLRLWPNYLLLLFRHSHQRVLHMLMSFQDQYSIRTIRAPSQGLKIERTSSIIRAIHAVGLDRNYADYMMPINEREMFMTQE